MKSIDPIVVLTKRVLALLMAISLLFVLSGCSFGKSRFQPQQVLRIGATAEPVTMDPTASPAAAGPQVMLYNVYQTLVRLDENGEFQPLLAKKWEISADRKKYTFELEPKARFSDGSVVDSEAIKANIVRIRDQVKIPALNTPMLNVTEVQVITPQKFIVQLKQPANEWFFQMTQTMGMIFNPKFFSDNAKQLATQTAGSGPYQLARWDRGAQIILSQNPNYWGSKPKFEQIIFRYFKDPNAMNAAMLSGGIDIISNLSAPQSMARFNSSEYQLLVGSSNGEVVLGINNAKPYFKDRKIRLAITKAINRAALMKSVWHNQGKLIGSMVPPTDPWYEDLAQLNSYDPQAARRLLQEAGYDFNQVLMLKVPALPYATKSAQYVASQLKDIGIKTEIQELVFPDAWLQTVYRDGDYDLTIVAHVEAHDITRFTDSKYYWHYQNQEFNKLISAAEAADTKTQIMKMKAAARLLAEDAPAVWLFLLPNIVVAKSDISGVPKNALSLSFDLTNITKTS